MIQPTNVQNPYPATGGANAVSINIYNPQAYGNTPNQNAVAPYQYTNSLYNIPTASAYMPSNLPVYQPQYAPQQFVTPLPQVMPQTVIAPEMNVAPMAEIPQANNAVSAQEVVPSVEIVEPQAPAQVVDVDTLVQNLKSTDADVRTQAINQIATYAQEAPEVALQVVSEPIMQSLVDIIKEDTSALAGPTKQQIAVAEKINKGKQLTPEENAIAEQLSPRDLANKNRIFALYTLAMIQKLQRDELNQYIETQKANGQETIAPLNVQDLVGFTDVINVIQNDPRSEVKVAAIQALQHILEPQDKASVEGVLAQVQNTKDEAVKTAAAEAMAKFQA